MDDPITPVPAVHVTKDEGAEEKRGEVSFPRHKPIHRPDRETIDGTVYRTRTSYDTGSRISTVTYPSSYVISNTYNAYGHLTSVTDPNGAYLWRAISDDERGNITEFKLGTQVDSIRAYDVKRGWLSSGLRSKAW